MNGLVKKRDVYIVISLIGALFLSACGINKNLKTDANRIVEAIENNNMDVLSQLVMGMQDIEMDEEVADFFSVSGNENNGIIAHIISQDTMKVKKIEDDVIVYEIIAPELINIFQDAETEENLTEDNFETYIYDYIENADKINIEVAVSYTYTDGIFKANYATEDFINGITGNMIISYQNFIQKMLSEYGEEENE